MNVSTDELCESIYQAISASVDQADAIDFATKAMKLAKGGFTDTATAVDIMTTAINAYGMSAADAESISDKLIMTQNKGKTTVGDLAAAMGRVIPAANTFGVSLDELCGYYATMTANGIATAETTTYLNSMIKELGTGSDTLYSQLENATESVLGEKKSFQELREEGYTVLDVIGILGQYSEQTGDSIIAKQIAYDDTKDKIFEYYDDISAYENASTLILQGNVTEAIDYMDKLGRSYKSAADVAGESAEKQKETLEQQKNDAQDYYVLLRSYYNSATEEQKKSIETRLEDAKEYAKKTAEEYAKVGENAVLSYKEGVESNQNSLTEKMSDLSKLAVKSAKDESDTSSVGENMVDGISSGVDKKSGSLFTKIRSLIKKSIFAAKDEADIHSPSKAFAKEVGAFIPPGIGNGVEENEEEAIGPVENLIDKMVVSGSSSVNTNNYRHNPAPTINASFSTAAIIDKLNQLMDMIASRGNDKIYLNGDVLVGELAPAMDSALGDISAASMRGQ